MKKLNITGHKFENWTVLSCAGIGKHSETLWLCQCDCGATKTIVGHKLTGNRKVRCNDCCNPFYKDNSGMRFGKLTVEAYVGKNNYGRTLWRCRCDCGGLVETITSSLLKGATSSCGDCTSNEVFGALQGQKFGRWTVFAKNTSKNRRVFKFLCRCDCGKEKLVRVDHLIDGKSQSCGCLRSELQSGENSQWWKGGITCLQTQIRNLAQYSQWRFSVFKRDNFTCCNCHKVGHTLNAHHIKPFAEILTEKNIASLDEATACEELWNIDNGVTLCSDCHKLAHQTAFTFKAE